MMPKRKLVMKKKLIVRKGVKRVVVRRKRSRAVNYVQKVTPSFAIDLDTPPHELVGMKCTKEGDEQAKTPCEEKQADQTAENVDFMELQMSVDADGDMEFTDGDGQQFQTSCEKETVQTARDLNFLENEMFVDAKDPMKCTKKYGQQHENPSQKETNQNADVNFLKCPIGKSGQQLQKQDEKETYQSASDFDSLQYQMTVDADRGDINFVQRRISPEIQNEDNLNKEISNKQQVGDENEKKIILLNVEVLNAIQSNEVLADIESNEGTNSQSDPLDDFNRPVIDIENAKINLEELINGDNPVWEEITSRYNQDGCLSKKLRKLMNEAIVQYARVKNIYIDLESMQNISYQICKLFHTETMTTYFLPITKGYSGSLYNLYHRKRSNDNKERKERNRNETNVEEISIPEPPESIAILKADGHSDDVYIDIWKETFEYRQKKISQYKTFDDFINEWPIITKPIGFSLVINYF